MTNQRRVLLGYLESHRDEQLSAKEIAESLKQDGISQSAVYRNLSALEADGKVHRFTKGGDRESYYQYLDCDECHGQLHFSCCGCGHTFHVSEKVADVLSQALSFGEHFSLDKEETVLYGLCGQCKKKAKVTK
ncbi:MAG: transcriptional repressor [Ruminococcus sp.]|nr:transcriptional repressor [Candidatus Apopatosoma intestinale]